MLCIQKIIQIISISSPSIHSGRVSRQICSLDGFGNLHRSFPLELVPSMMPSFESGENGCERDEVDKLPVEKPLDEYDPDIGD